MNDQIIRDLIASRVKRGDMFTAYDVSKEVQQRGVRAGHYKGGLRDITHQIFASGEMAGYSKTLVDLGNGLQAFVYHPDNTDPFLYKSKHLDGVAPSPTPAAQTQMQQSTPAAIDGTLDIENRLNIPTELFKSLNIEAHDPIVIAIYDTHIFISIDSNLNRSMAKGATAYDMAVVTAKGNYRICDRIRSKSRDLAGLDNYKISATGSSIKIEPA